MSVIYCEIASLLQAIEAELRMLTLWEDEPPGAVALASTEPFCVDTLEFHQWLQFVFLPRLCAMTEQRQPLPQRCGIAPMAEEYLRARALHGPALVALLDRLDQLLSQQ